MQPFTILSAKAWPLGRANVDTDQLIPARFMGRPRGDGYGGFLLHDLRSGAAGGDAAILDDARYSGAAVLVARRNFGSGSSREAAVYALWDFGIRCVVAPSFGDIFASNAVKNGLLPAVADELAVEALLSWLGTASEPVVTVDLAAQSIVAGGFCHAIAVEPVRRMQLLNGWDDIDLTMRHTEEIAAFRKRSLDQLPWTWPTTASGAV